MYKHAQGIGSTKYGVDLSGLGPFKARFPRHRHRHQLSCLVVRTTTRDRPDPLQKQPSPKMRRPRSTGATAAVAASPAWVLVAAAVAAVAMAAACYGRGCQAFLLPGGFPSSRWGAAGAGGSAASRWHGQRVAAPVVMSVLTIGYARGFGCWSADPTKLPSLHSSSLHIHTHIDTHAHRPGRSQQQRGMGIHPALYAASTAITAAPAPKHGHHADWARFGEENAPTLLGLRRAAIKGNVEAGVCLWRLGD